VLAITESSKSYPSISFRIDEETKKTAGDVFGELGMDMTTGLTIYLRKVARDKKIPFDLSVAEPDAEYKTHILKTLAERKEKAKDLNTKWYSTNEMREMFEIEKS